MTRDGRNVRILCTDAKGDYPIVTLMETLDGSIEFVNKFKKDGHFLDNDGNKSNLDLFFVPEKHEVWVNVYKGDNRDYFTLGSMIYDRKEDAERCRIEETCVATVKIEWEDE